MRVVVEKVDFYYVTILLKTSCNSKGGAFCVHLRVLSMTITQKRRYSAHREQTVPRVRRRPISGGGGSDGRFRGASDTSEIYEGFTKDFLDCPERACLQILPEDGNGHCGILALQRTKRPYLGSSKNDVVPEGRQELVDAYQKHRARLFLKDHGSWFNVTDKDVVHRISIHLAARTSFALLSFKINGLPAISSFTAPFLTTASLSLPLRQMLLPHHGASMPFFHSFFGPFFYSCPRLLQKNGYCPCILRILGVATPFGW